MIRVQTKLILSAVTGFAGVVAAGLPYRTVVTEYTLCDPRIVTPLKIVILSDYHNDRSDQGTEALGKRVREMNPDLILMPGDMAEEHNHQERTFLLLRELAGIPMFYCTGNHEEFRWDLTQLKERFREHGVTVLDEKSCVFHCGDTALEIGGISCRLEMEHFTPEEINDLFHTDHYRILLSHKPNWHELYRQLDCDLVVCGHAHGGQWHIPVVNIPIAAPSQGLFPKNTEGIHELGRVSMLISRGLVRHYHGIPRLFNDPEIVVLHLCPDATEIR